MASVSRALNPGFLGRNLVAYNFAGFTCISFVVFLLASQPYYLSDVIGIKSDNIGKVTGSLGVADEIMAILTSPLIGTLNDRLQGIAWKLPKLPSGSRILQFFGFSILAVSLLGYGKIASKVVPDLYILRALFAVGVSTVMSIAVVMLHEASNSDFTWLKLKFWKVERLPEERILNQLQQDEAARERDVNREPETGEQLLFLEQAHDFYTLKKNQYYGKLSALLGMCTGCGAIFAVSVFLPLPARLSLRHEDWTTAQCLEVSYTILGVTAFVIGLVVFASGYDSVKQRKVADRNANAESESPDLGYLQLMKEAVVYSLHSRKVQLAYMGGFIARSTTVATSVFTPIIVYKFYSSIGACGNPEGGAEAHQRADVPPQKNDCYNAFIFLAILTGVSSTVSLLLAPLWSIAVDAQRLGSVFALFLASCLGTLGCVLLCILGWSSPVYDPRDAWCFVALGLIGMSQMGAIIASMSLVSKAGQLLEDSEHRIIGGITGLYNLCGGMGILIISKVGGTWSDHWVFGPFFILGLINLVLMAFASIHMKQIK